MRTLSHGEGSGVGRTNQTPGGPIFVARIDETIRELFLSFSLFSSNDIIGYRSNPIRSLFPTRLRRRIRKIFVRSENCSFRINDSRMYVKSFKIVCRKSLERGNEKLFLFLQLCARLGLRRDVLKRSIDCDFSFFPFFLFRFFFLFF